MHLPWIIIGTVVLFVFTACSWSTFRRIWKMYFGKKLGFRKESEHAKCDACEGYKKELRCADTLANKLQIAGRYTKHLQDQWNDREIYWKLRHLSILTLSSIFVGTQMTLGLLAMSVLCVMIDGMDQAKYRCPRDSSKQKTKTSEKLPRPALHVTGTLIHGAGLRLTVSEPDLPKDSNQQAECFARGLNDVYEESGQFPLHAHIHMDNTSREGKNQFFFMFVALLVLMGTFKSITLQFLRKGLPHPLPPLTKTCLVHSNSKSPCLTCDC